jgi:hypothetical protein
MPYDTGMVEAMRLPIILSRSTVHLAALGRGAGRKAKVLERCVKLIYINLLL